MSHCNSFLRVVLLAGAAGLTPLYLPGVVDLNDNGQSDIFERYYGITLTPDEDPDGDRQPNKAEAVAGTNPHDANDRLAIFDGEAPSGQTMALTFASKEGKRYRFEYCRDVGQGPWQPLGPSWEGTGEMMTVQLPLLLPVYQTGNIRFEYWLGIGGSSVNDLRNDPDFPLSPDGTMDLTSFNSPNDFENSYGGRVHGYVVAPETGSYTFYVASDDNGELYLSSSDDPADKTLIASVPGWAGSGDWDKYPEQQSAPVQLQAGQGYYIEGLFKEGGGGDRIQVAWSLPSDPGTITLIDGAHLAIPEKGTGEDLSLLDQLFLHLVVVDMDTDGDGISDMEERLLGFNPAEGDSDNDGTNDLTALTSMLSAPNEINVAATLPNIPEVAFGGQGEFTLTRSGGIDAVTVHLNLGGTAANGVDYQTLASTVTLPFAVNELVVPVAPIGDGDTEPDETVLLQLLADSAYVVGGEATAEVTIEESAPPDTPFIASLRPVTAGQTNAFGTAILGLGFFDQEAHLDLTFSGLSSTQLSATLHVAAPGQSGPSVLSLPLNQINDLTWTFSPTGDFTVAEIAQAIRDGELYVSIQTQDFPGGEIRGHFSFADGSLVPPAPLPAPPLPGGPPTPEDAARLLTQATFGPTMAEIQNVQTMGIGPWIDHQMTLPWSSHYQTIQDEGGQFQNGRQQAWWKHAVEAPDQLRQRMAFALSEIFVISDRSSELTNRPEAMAHYYDLLGLHAFGNFRELLEEITLNPLMGKYLDMLKNEKPNLVTGTLPDENYAREVLQLFSIGKWKLHQDGTFVYDEFGFPIPTYGQKEIVGFAHTFTGFNYYNPDGTRSWNYGVADDFNPMSLYPDYHDTGPKELLDGVVLPAGQDGNKDLADALDLIANHPNVGPFICKLLIQRMVTSNPSTAYLYRVSAVFNDDGTGQRGNLGAVAKAILTDPEARLADYYDNVGYGKWREPLLKATHLFRAYGAHPVNPNTPDDYWRYWNADSKFGQAALRAPSVFNFFEPEYIAPGIIAELGLLSPEAQIASETNVMKTINELWQIINRQGLQGDDKPWRVRWTWPSALTDKIGATPAEHDIDGMLDYLDLLFMSGQMTPEMRQTLTDLIVGLNSTDAERLFVNLTYCILNSPEYSIQK